MANGNNTLPWVIAAGAAYLLLRQPPPRGAPYQGAFGPGGTQVSGPGFSYRTGPGGTNIALDPSILQSLFGTPTSGTQALTGADYAPPFSPVYAPDTPSYPEIVSPFDDPTYVQTEWGTWVPPDYVNDPCFYVPDPSCAPSSGDLSSVW